MTDGSAAHIENALQHPDVAAVQQIPIIQTILDLVCRTTGLGFSAVARVTDTQWITCSVLDKIQFGLKPGDELVLESTICNEIRESHVPVIINHVAEDPFFASHHTPLQYGFQSYISFPIFRRDGSFFGTLCAIDPAPARLDTPELQTSFQLYAELISFHLDLVDQDVQTQMELIRIREEQLVESQLKNAALERRNRELEDFTHVVSHDLQEPLRKIRNFAELIRHDDADQLSSSGQFYFGRLESAVVRMQHLVKDLILLAHATNPTPGIAPLDLRVEVAAVRQDLEDDFARYGGSIELQSDCPVYASQVQFRQLLHNVIGNALKYGRPGVPPLIRIEGNVIDGASATDQGLRSDRYYSHIRISDNGIGFEAQYKDKIFEIFQRLHGREDYEGTGIGLAIVKRIVENYEGRITATGAANEGARFDIFLPVRAAASQKGL